MNITQDVVRDLLPAYYSGESSADTQAVIEEYLRLNPAFAMEARNVAKIFQSMGELAAPDLALEKITLKRAKRILLGQKILFSAATTFAANAIALQFSFEFGQVERNQAGRFQRQHLRVHDGRPRAEKQNFLLRRIPTAVRPFHQQ